MLGVENNKILITDASEDDLEINSEDFEQIQGGKIYLKGISKEKMLKMASKGIQKLGPEFNCYARVSPENRKGRRERDKTQPKHVKKIKY